MSTRIAFVTILSMTAAGAAFAAGPEPVAVEPAIAAAPVAPVAPFWAGGYIGAQLGYAYGDFDIDDAIDGDDDDDGFIGGITAGYLWSLNNGWYLGPEFQYDWADKLTVTDSGDSISFDEIARLKLIAGREIGNGLVYGSGGIAYSDLDSAGDIFDGLDGGDTNWVLGFGYDHRVGDNWTVGGEFQYHDFDDLNVNTLHLKAAYRF